MSGLCNEVKMTRQNYYKARRQAQVRDVEKERICAVVRSIRKDHVRIGTVKLKKRLAEKEIEIGRDRLFSVLRTEGLLVPPAPRKARTTNSRHNLPIFTNQVKGLAVMSPNQVWVSDITYLRINGSFVYLSLIMDLYSRKIVGWHCGDTLEAIGCMQALRMAFRSLKKGDRPIHHSDRGSQYCCHAYVDLLKSRGLQISMTEENHCYENAHAERLNGILKQEYGLGWTFRNRNQTTFLNQIQ